MICLHAWVLSNMCRQDDSHSGKHRFVNDKFKKFYGYLWIGISNVKTHLQKNLCILESLRCYNLFTFFPVNIYNIWVIQIAYYEYDIYFSDQATCHHVSPVISIGVTQTILDLVILPSVQGFSENVEICILGNKSVKIRNSNLKLGTQIPLMSGEILATILNSKAV